MPRERLVHPLVETRSRSATALPSLISPAGAAAGNSYVQSTAAHRRSAPRRGVRFGRPRHHRRRRGLGLGLGLGLGSGSARARVRARLGLGFRLGGFGSARVRPGTMTSGSGGGAGAGITGGGRSFRTRRPFLQRRADVVERRRRTGRLDRAERASSAIRARRAR